MHSPKQGPRSGSTATTAATATIPAPAPAEADAPAGISAARLNACRTAAGAAALQRAIRALTPEEVAKLARSLEFEAVIEGAPPDLLAALRPRLRQLRPPRLPSLERRCWAPLQRFLSDREAPEPGAPWIVPRRVVVRLWDEIARRHPELLDQLRRRLVVALFDDDAAGQDEVSTQVGDLAAFFVNNTAVKAVPGLNEDDAPAVRFIARVLKWHRLIMPNVRYYQQVAAAQAARSQVDALRLHTNWYTVYERLDEQFDLYLIYLFEMTPSPADVIDAFPFYFDTLEKADGLVMDWLAYRCERLAQGIADILAKPLRTLPSDTLFELFLLVQQLAKLTERIGRLPVFARNRKGRPPAATPFDGVMRRVPGDGLDRAVDCFLDDLHDLLNGTPDRQERSARLLPRFAVALPVLLGLFDTGDKASRAARARFRLGEMTLETVDRFSRNTTLAPQTRRDLGLKALPAVEMCRRFGLSEDAEGLARRLRR
ncbi:MAG TPA: hypothetical protein VEB20_06285 [Azospirillaceae bacterium]|nr:hypothetical protein [Azospirillaceae bacterium]